MIRHKNRNRIEVITKPSLFMLGEVKHEVSTTKGLKSTVVEILVNGKSNQSQRVFSPRDVGVATKAMLRIEHLLGNYSAFTRAALNGKGTTHRVAPAPVSV